MHWADKIANKVVKTRPDKEKYVCAAGISPSGSVHIGNFRDVATVFFVAKAIEELGKKTQIIFSWDDYDRFRKVPVNIPKNFSSELGKPYSAIPDPFECHDSYARHFENAFEQEMEVIGIKLDYRYQTLEYQSGRYAQGVKTALQKRKEIYDILAQFRTQEPTDEERENYYPITIYCSKCLKDDANILGLSDDFETVTYKCKCGHEDTIELSTGKNYKLPWKIDWPMRWMYEGVDFEPGGKDHATPGGSYFVARRISEAIFDYPAPVFQGYEFVGITGSTSKMSGSSGLALTPGQLLNVYQPEILLWNFARYNPTKAFNICLDEEILRQFDEFDRAYTAVENGKASDQVKRNIELSRIGDKKIKTVPFRQLASFSTIIKGNPQALEEIFKRLDTPFTKEDFEERLQKAEYWLTQYSPESVIKLKETADVDYISNLNEEEQSWISSLYSKLSQEELSFEELTMLLYAIPKKSDLEDKENKIRQRRFFVILYMLLIGKETGPRLATFLQALGPEKFLHLINLNDS